MCKEKEKELQEINEAIETYNYFLSEALCRDDEKEASFLKSQIQRCKRMKVALKKEIPFEEHPSEVLYFAMMGA